MAALLLPPLPLLELVLPLPLLLLLLLVGEPVGLVVWLALVWRL